MLMNHMYTCGSTDVTHVSLNGPTGSPTYEPIVQDISWTCRQVLAKVKNMSVRMEIKFVCSTQYTHTHTHTIHTHTHTHTCSHTRTHK